MITRARSNLRSAITGWSTDWERMAAQLISSFIVGQSFWRWGYDELKLPGASDRIMKVGLGQTVATRISGCVPHTRAALLTVKVIEILADLGKCPVESLTYRRYGIIPDIVGCAVTQPLWSLLEVAEKIASMARSCDRYGTWDEQEFLDSAACIYGTLIRYGLDAGILAFGPQINARLTEPLTRRIRQTGMIVPSVAAVLVALKTWRAIRAYRDHAS